MISTYKNIQNNIKELNSLCNESAQIQKIYSSSYYISLQIRIPSKNLFILIGRGHGNEGLWFSETQIPSVLRKKDRFLEYLRKHIAGCRLLSFTMDMNDRAFKISFVKWRRECEIFFHYSGRDLYFQTKIWSEKKDDYEYFQSWRGKVNLTNMSFSDFDEIGRKDVLDKEVISRQKSSKQLLNEEFKKAEGQGSSHKSKKFLDRKLKNINNDLDRVLNYKKLEQIIDVEDFSLFEKKGKIHSIKFNFTTDSHFARRDEVYKKIKKLKKAEEILKLRLKDTEIKIQQKKVDLSKTENKLKIVEPIWKVSKVGPSKKVLDEYIIEDFKTYKVGIGRSSVGNDQLRSKFAHKDDWWFHLSDRPSSHIIIKNIKSIDDEIISFVAEKFLILENAIEVDLVYTQVKNLKSIKGKSGLVKYKKEKYFRYLKKN